MLGGWGGGGVNLRWTSISSRGNRNTPMPLVLSTETGIRSGLMAHLARMQTYAFLPTCTWAGESNLPLKTRMYVEALFFSVSSGTHSRVG